MKFIDEYRDPYQVEKLLEQLRCTAKKLPYRTERPMRIMEVCGGHTHAIYRFGLDKLLPSQLEFIHGPGCPVCVLPMERIDACREIAAHPEVIFCTFGDAMRVPGVTGSLISARAQGADVRVVWSPLDALSLSRQYPERQVVFFALGFETTMPATALTIQLASQQKVANFTLFCQHITLMPLLRHLLQQKDNTIDAFLAPGHVSAVIGENPWQFICQQFAKPLVISGFEPVDILQSLLMLLQQKIAESPRVENQYRRVVRAAGNPLAKQAIDDVFTLRNSNEWRGLGKVPASGFSLSHDYRQFDTEARFKPLCLAACKETDRYCGEVLTGQRKPCDCPFLGKRCTPQNPAGALMVSTEGACAAFYEYRFAGEINK